MGHGASWKRFEALCIVKRLESSKLRLFHWILIDFSRSRLMDQGSRIMDHGSWVKDQASRILDFGPCSGMNYHPGRDTDVISRPSKSTIRDLSFYIGFTRIQSRIKHLGPCLGTNDHFRRDPDLISRPPES